MHATGACALGVQGTTKADYLGPQGRVRIEVKLIARKPANLRMDAINPFTHGPVGTLTSDGKNFALMDMQNKKFLVGPALPCSIGMLLGGVQLPGHVIVDALRGEAPVLRHAQPGSIAWDGSGYYVIRLAGTSDASEEIHLLPHPDDWNKPWGDQRVRVLDFSVVQKGYMLYHVALDDHHPIQTAPAFVDPEHIDPDILPSGPACNAEIPRRIHIESPAQGADLRLSYTEAAWNPPLQPNVFAQQALPGLVRQPVDCER